MKAAFCLIVMILAVFAKAASEEPTVLYEHDPTLLTTTVQVVWLSGSADDPKGQAGLSALLGEMLLRGTLKKSKEQFHSEVERLGASISVGTGYENTSFVGSVIKENTVPFLKLFEETLYRPGFPKKEFEPLKRETIAGVAHMKNNNMRLAGLALRRELFAGTNLETPGMGTLSSLKRIKLEDIIKVYSKDFHRGNLLFAVASPVPESELKPHLVTMWKKFTPGETKKRSNVAANTPPSLRLVLVQKPKTSTGSLMFGQPGITAQDPLRYALNTANFSFGGEPLVSRLFRTIRSELGWTYSIGSTYQAIGQLMNQQGLFIISSTPSVEYTAKSLLRIQNMWQDFLKKGLESEELELAQDSLVNSYPFEFDEARKRLGNVVRSHLYGVPVLSPEAYEKEIRGLSNGDLKKALGERQKDKSWVVALVADKAIIEKQLEEEQKDVPADQRLKIAKVYTPEQLVD